MSRYGNYYGDWAPYVPVAERQAKAAKYAQALAKKEKRSLAPVKIEGRTIAKSFWGKAWCNNLERYSDYSNRLPRGGTYVRNGSVVDLQIGKGSITALVSGSEVYTIKIKIATLAQDVWEKIKKDCSRSIDSLLDLLQGKFDQGVMERLTQKEDGLFPRPKEISLDCSCPDSAGMCKHIAATMYGVGHRLDSSPELLFQLRAVDHLELIGAAVSADNLQKSLSSTNDNTLAGNDLGELFGIELDVAGTVAEPTTTNVPKIVKPRKSTATKRTAKKTASPEKSTDRGAMIATEVDTSAPTKPIRKAAKRSKSVASASSVSKAVATKKTKAKPSAKTLAAPKRKAKKTTSTQTKAAAVSDQTRKKSPPKHKPK
ncbi:MAG: SWIM zinc finger family protein [Schlesneria sp.]